MLPGLGANSAETHLQPETATVQSMDEITFKIRQGQQDLTVVRYDSPLNVAQAKQALLEENSSWIGALQEEGSSRRVGGDQQLKPGSSYILTLQCQAGECYLLLLLYCCCLVLGFAVDCTAIRRRCHIAVEQHQEFVCGLRQTQLVCIFEHH